MGLIKIAFGGYLKKNGDYFVLGNRLVDAFTNLHSCRERLDIQISGINAFVTNIPLALCAPDQVKFQRTDLPVQYLVIDAFIP